jgi:hypothetical protein
MKRMSMPRERMGDGEGTGRMISSWLQEIPQAGCGALQGLDMKVLHELGNEDDVEEEGENE